jgi:protein pelota
VRVTEKNLKQGFLKVIPDSQDDLWHLYNIITKDDEAYAYSSRAIKSDTETSRPKSGERVSAFMGVKVESVSWDKFLGKLRIHGTIIHAPDPIPPGAHHTLAIALNQSVTIVKKTWPKHLLDRLERASRNEKPILIVAIDDECFAIAETKQYGVDIKVEERQKLPGKHEAEKRDSAAIQYFTSVANSLRQLWEQTKQPIVIVGVGFVKNDFSKFLADETKDMFRAVVDLKSVNNGGTAGIYEALRSGVLLKAASRLRVVKETEVVEEIMKRLGKGEGKIAYGLTEVEAAVGLGAAEKLVVADSMLREAGDKQRLQLEKLMRDIERRNGEVMVVSTENEAGSKLTALGGIAALLRFAIK